MFHKLRFLPPELKHLIFAKVKLGDRSAASRASPEMGDYFKKYRMQDDVRIWLCKENEKCYIELYFYDYYYSERHTVPQELEASVTEDLLCSLQCECDLCWNCEYADEVQFRHFDEQTFEKSSVFDTLTLVKVRELHLRSVPRGGLVDLLQPTIGILLRASVLEIHWHNTAGVVYPRNDLDVNIENWGRWIDFASPGDLLFRNNQATHGDDWDSGEEHHQPLVYLPKDLFELKSIHGVNYLYSECGVDIDYRQLIKMGWYIELPFQKLERLGAMDVFDFYKEKAEAWIDYPGLHMEYRFQSSERSDNPPHLNHKKLLADSTKYLRSEEFLVYIDFYPENPNHKVCRRCITIRTVNYREPRALIIGPDRMFSWDVPQNFKWPEPTAI